MVLNLAKLEMRDIERLDRQALLEAIENMREHIPDDLAAAAERMPTEHLRLLILTARVVCALRLLQQPWPPAGPDVPGILDR